MHSIKIRLLEVVIRVFYDTFPTSDIMGRVLKYRTMVVKYELREI
jgi:hypothetical protein